MSVTFTSDAKPTEATNTLEPCLCSQMAPSWAYPLPELTSEIRADLAAHANPECPLCHGEGLEGVVQTNRPELNFANGNARIVLEVLGLDSNDLFGELPVAGMRRALMRGRARNLESYTRSEETMHGAPSRREDGTIELRPIRGFACGLSAAEIRARLEQLSAMVEKSAEMGATVIRWG
jgi:hypothetical protein